MKVVAIRDRALNAFMQPFFTPAIAAGIRAFTDEVNRADSPPYQHPEDYDLYYLGEYNEDSGMFIQSGPPTQIAVGKEVHRGYGGRGPHVQPGEGYPNQQPN